jgi:hypothetical protein
MIDNFDDGEDLIELLDDLDDYLGLDDDAELEDDYPSNINDIFTLQVTLAIRTNNFDYFIKLFSPSFFIDITARNKFSQIIACIEYTTNTEKQLDFLECLIIKSEITKTDFNSCCGDLLTIDQKIIDEIFARREMNKFAIDLPINQIVETKKTKV